MCSPFCSCQLLGASSIPSCYCPGVFLCQTALPQLRCEARSLSMGWGCSRMSALLRALATKKGRTNGHHLSARRGGTQVRSARTSGEGWGTGEVDSSVSVLTGIVRTPRSVPPSRWLPTASSRQYSGGWPAQSLGQTSTRRQDAETWERQAVACVPRLTARWLAP